MQARITNPKTIDRGTIAATLAAGQTPILQFDSPTYTPALLRSVNALCAEFGARIHVRFYGHHTAPFDAAALQHLPDVRALLADCLLDIANPEWLGRLDHLEYLSLGVFQWNDPSVLSVLKITGLRWLALSDNAKRNIDLRPLEECHELETLFIVGHIRNIDTIAALPKLDRLSLSGMPKRRDLGFLAELSSLRSLSLWLGSRASIDELNHTDLTELFISRVRGLKSIGPLDRLPALQRLTIEDQLQLESISVGGTALREISLFNCKNLAEVAGLEELRNLQQFRTGRTKLDLDNLLTQEWPAAMRCVALYSGSQKWNEAAQRELAARGYAQFC